MSSPELARRALPDGSIAIAYYDHNPDNPRHTQDNLGIVNIFVQQYNIGDDHDFKTRADWDDHQDSLPARHPDKAQHAAGINCYDHGAYTLSTKPIVPGYGTVGVWYTTRQRIRQFGLRINADADQIKAIMAAEIEELDRYARGEYYDARVFAACPCCGQPTGEPIICYGAIAADTPEDGLAYLDADFPTPATEPGSNCG